MSHYNFMAMPVVDYEGRLLGVATYDDILDIMQDEASADLLGMVGAGQDETVDTPWLESVQIRLPWLIVNMVTSMMSAFVVYMFEGSIAGMALLAVLMPMVANQAGNTGQQGRSGRDDPSACHGEVRSQARVDRRVARRQDRHRFRGDHGDAGLCRRLVHLLLSRAWHGHGSGAHGRHAARRAGGRQHPLIFRAVGCTDCP